ncbi:hypothetical protein Sru01_14390 [Sphaerisporangium rufum]|uniref:Uncharacterized protein n=1 Tax=Sphaerisporangium rufum TaxID=1381558 RepID=A0A919QYS0_9ACTN|nr:hypothetical protein [Sphaerisporangium rufum]GII76457.1 hypothetical protein Sru01_14390 [Sphaerisporangium rufum]
MAFAAVTVTALAAGTAVTRAGETPAATGAAALSPPAATGAAAATPGGGARPAAADARASKPAKARKASKARDRARTASGPSKHTDATAVGYFQERVTAKAAKRVTDIRTVGNYLRIYTDLPDTAHNSKAALELCKRGKEYLVEEKGERSPVVFVQAEYGQNGNPVLANILGPGDHSCRLTYPKPK